MKGTMATLIVSVYAVVAGGAEHISGPRWVLPAHRSAFMAPPAPRSPTVSRCAGFPQSAVAQPSNKHGFFVQSKSRSSVTRVFASADDVDLKVDHEQEMFCCQNAFFFASMCDVAYSPREKVRTIFQGNETVTGLGFEHFHWFEAPKEESSERYFDAIQDTEAYVAANDDVIIAVFRGTSELSDWATNIEIIPRRVDESWGLKGEGCDVHMGFDDGVNTVWGGNDGMLETIKMLINEEGKNRKLYVSGHSLGAALATIAGARLVFEHDINVSGIYTVGSPRVFDGQLSKHFDEKINHGTAMKDKHFRCRNNNDIVPRMVPPPFEHAGTEVYLDRHGQIKPMTAWDQFLGRYDAYMKLDFEEDISDHSTSEYIRIFKQLVIDQEASA
eukprot:jgi/Undpi1/12054/HiC_scaffold_4.g01753.m2